MKPGPSRREWLTTTTAAVGATLTAGAVGSGGTVAEEKKDMFRYALNTATIRGQKLSLVEEVEIAARAGYDALEPWIDNLQKFVQGGGNLKDLGKRVRDRGLTVESAIGFAEWIVDDEAHRKKGLEEMRHAMDLVQQLGGTRIAAPPAGATKQTDLNLFRAAERYRTLLELGDQQGVVPQLEVWGFSKSISRLGEAAFVAIESDHPKACVLADVFHLYKGGSGFGGLKLLSAEALHVLHMNDYPAKPGRAEINDSYRVYPGDGVAPLKELLHDLRQIGFRGVLSLEIFNPEYYKQDPLAVARAGLDKMKAVAASSRL